MAILVSPSNNTGWGLTKTYMYGGAREFSDDTPVHVREYYRAPWGSKKGRVVRRRRRRRAAARAVEDIAEAAAEAVAEATTRRKRKRRGRRPWGRKKRRVVVVRNANGQQVAVQASTSS
ncbi:pVII [Bat mastadenovirus WIV17]|uniref:PVII n=1 Tax=Bat mastadenovirus WIV17 TaxID=1986505 RepID=A0A1X9RIS2_9ADEN|nr:pVII [Bat mastadenovirus WIV17]ARQ79752.1 pVII [Bat mastadenovirus WIV17]